MQSRGNVENQASSHLKAMCLSVGRPGDDNQLFILVPVQSLPTDSLVKVEEKLNSFIKHLARSIGKDTMDILLRYPLNA